MKKLVFGCFGVLVVLAVIGGIAAYVYVIEPAREYYLALKQVAALADLDKQVANQAAFRPPDTGELTAEAVARVADVQQAVQEALGRRVEQLRERYGDLERRAREAPAAERARHVIDAYRDLIETLYEGRRAQVEALNRLGISQEEYEWVSRQMYQAAGLLVSSIDLAALQRAMASGNLEADVRTPAPAGDVPERNRELVRPYLDRLRSRLPLAWFGL